MTNNGMPVNVLSPIQLIRLAHITGATSPRAIAIAAYVVSQAVSDGAGAHSVSEEDWRVYDEVIRTITEIRQALRIEAAVAESDNYYDGLRDGPEPVAEEWWDSMSGRAAAAGSCDMGHLPMCEHHYPKGKHARM